MAGNLFYAFQKVLHGKGQVRLAGTKVKDLQGLYWPPAFLGLRQVVVSAKSAAFLGLRPRLEDARQNVVQKLQKTVDLPELVVLCGDDFSSVGHNAKRLQKWNLRSLFYDVVFGTVQRALVGVKDACGGAEKRGFFAKGGVFGLEISLRGGVLCLASRFGRALILRERFFQPADLAALVGQKSDFLVFCPLNAVFKGMADVGA